MASLVLLLFHQVAKYQNFMFLCGYREPVIKICCKIFLLREGYVFGFTVSKYYPRFQIFSWYWKAFFFFSVILKYVTVWSLFFPSYWTVIRIANSLCMQRNLTGNTFTYVDRKVVLVSQLKTIKWWSALKKKSKPNDFSVNLSYCNSVSLVLYF